MKRLFCATITSISLALPSIASSAERPATLNYECKFELMASLDGLEIPKDFNLKFHVETASGKAVMIGNNGMSDVTAINGPYGITFLEVLGSGVVQSTTVANRSFDAVHSRHSIISHELIPSQYYGKCKVGPS